MNTKSLTRFSLSYKEKSTIQTFPVTAVLMCQCTIPRTPSNQTIDITHCHSSAPSSIEPLGIPIPPSNAMRHLPNLSSYLCSPGLQNCRGGGLSRIPGYCRGGRRMLSTSHGLSCQFSSGHLANAPPSPRFKSLPSFAFPPDWASTGLQLGHRHSTAAILHYNQK
jgi:hypothetical protein